MTYIQRRRSNGEELHVDRRYWLDKLRNFGTTPGLESMSNDNLVQLGTERGRFRSENFDYYITGV